MRNSASRRARSSDGRVESASPLSRAAESPASGGTAPASAALTEALRAAAGCVRSMVPDASLVLELARGDGQPLRIVDAADGGAQGDTAWVDMVTCGGPLQAARERRESIVIDDLSTDPRWPDHSVGALAAGYRACCAVPLAFGDDGPLGALAVYSGESHAFDQRSPAFVSAAAWLLRPSVTVRSSASRQAEQSFDVLAGMVPGIVYQRLVSPDGSIKYTYISHGVKEMFGVDASEVLADSEVLFRQYSPEYRAKFRERLLEASRNLTMWDVEASVITPDGQTKFTHAIARPAPLDDGSVLWTGVILDATRIKEAEARAAQAEERTRRSIVESLSQGFMLFDAHDRLQLVNSHFFDLYPQMREVAVPGANYAEVVEAELTNGKADGQALTAAATAVAGRLFDREQRARVFEYELDPERWIQVNEHRTPTGERAVLYTDVSELKLRERRIQYLAYHDALTQLPNRTLFRQRLEEALQAGQTGHINHAVLCLDLDHFKNINDTLGHPAGDAVLKAVAQRLKACLRERDTAARLGGDEFALIVTDLPSPDFASSLAQRIVQVLSEPIEIGGQPVFTGTSIGISLAPGDGDDAETLLKNADLALYRAKSDGRGTFHFFEAEMDARARKRRMLETDLRAAIAGDELQLHYQPLVDIYSDEIIGVEALLRWRHPTRGNVPPLEFIGLAEETGLIAQLGTWVIRRACQDASGWPDTVRVAVNVSPAQFRDRELAKRIAAILVETGCPGHRLEIEITESLLFKDTDANLATLHEIRSLGVRVSMDDFGTGFSSLSNLRSFPFDKIKIDRSFVTDLHCNRDSAAIVRAVLSLGRTLGIKTTAEGVETRDQIAFLRAEGCTEVQGFFYSPPRPHLDITSMIEGDRRISPAKGKA